MNSQTTRHFRDLLASLPEHVQRHAEDAYALFQQNSSHPGLRFEQVDSGPPPVYSARVGMGHRAVGSVRGNTVVWFWIGSHADYDKLLKHL